MIIGMLSLVWTVIMTFLVPILLVGGFIALRLLTRGWRRSARQGVDSEPAPHVIETEFTDEDDAHSEK